MKTLRKCRKNCLCIAKIFAVLFVSILFIWHRFSNEPQLWLNYQQKFFSDSTINYNINFQTLETANFCDIPAEAKDPKNQFFGLIYKNTYGLPTTSISDRNQFYKLLAEDTPTWQSLMPEVAFSLKILDFYNPSRFQEAFTSSKSNVIYSKSAPLIYEVDEKFEAKIQARNFLNQPKNYGGDYFRARLMKIHSSDVRLADGIPCFVEDHFNGTYTLSAPLPLQGTFRLEILLCASVEAIDSYVKWAHGRKYQGFVFHTKLQSNEVVLCNSDLLVYDMYKDKKICNYSNLRNGEPYFCTTPYSGICSPIKFTSIFGSPVVIDPSYIKYPHDIITELQTKFKSYKEISGSGTEIVVKPHANSTIQYESKMIQRTISLSKQNAISRPTGYSYNGHWRSLLYNYQAKSLPDLANCFSNKVVYLLGDSTMRQFFTILEKPLNLKVSVPDQDKYYHVPRVGINEKLNITLYYRAHGPPIRNPGPPSIAPFMTDTIDTIDKGGDDLVIVINLGLHYVEYNPLIFLHRLTGIKKALIRHSAKYPGTKIIIKGMNVSNLSRLPFEWLILRHDRILKEMFKDLKNSIFIDLWDMTTLRPLSIDYHPSEEIITDQALLMFNHICN